MTTRERPRLQRQPSKSLRKRLPALIRRLIRRFHPSTSHTRLYLLLTFLLFLTFFSHLPSPKSHPSHITLSNSASHKPPIPPRPALYIPSPGRRTSTLSPSSLLAPIHTVLHCTTPSPHLCCAPHSLIPTLRSLVRQTLVPTHITILHDCPTPQLPALRRAARLALDADDDPRSSFSKIPALALLHCQSPLCVLSHLAHLSIANVAPFALVLDVAHILEPTAVEKLWLSLQLRPELPAVRALAYLASSLANLTAGADHPTLPRNLPISSDHPVDPWPVLANTTAYRTAIQAAMRGGPAPMSAVPAGADRAEVSTVPGGQENEMWAPFLHVLARGRVVREALFTALPHSHAQPRPLAALSLDRFAERKADFLPAHLFSELAAMRWAARKDEDEMYAQRFEGGKHLDVAPLPFPGLERRKEVSAFLVLPWMQMGGSEKCMLDIARHMIKVGWSVTFVLTMPFWYEDPIGEIGLQHQWMDKALALSSDVFDLLALASHEHAVRAFRHLIESRRPNFVLTANSRWMYTNSRFLQVIAPRTIVADYNHMIHMNWEGGGMPRYGANNSEHFDLHLTASRNVADAMRRWIDKDILEDNPEKVQPCHIGTDPSMLYHGDAKLAARDRMRRQLGIAKETVVVLFAGRFVIDKGLDVMADLVMQVGKDESIGKRVVFLFVGSGSEEYRLRNVHAGMTNPNVSRVIIRPSAHGLVGLREYYAASDVLVLPSVNEGIALVIYEAMAAGVLVIATDVGGQKEVVTKETGVLLPNFLSISRMTTHTLEKVKEFVEHPERFAKRIVQGRDLVRNKYTTDKFCSCVMNHLIRARKLKEEEEDGGDEEIEEKDEDWEDGGDDDEEDDEGEDGDEEEMKGLGKLMLSLPMKQALVQGALIERHHGLWNLGATSRAIENAVTIGVKTYVCDDSIVGQVRSLVRSVRVHYPKVRVLLGNDGPMGLGGMQFVRGDAYTEEVRLPRDCGISFGRNYMVNMTLTRYFLLLDDDHVFDDTTNLTVLVDGIRDDGFDLVGLRVRNLPGIDELERTGIVIPRYVGLIRKLVKKELTVCVWNENKGPSIFGITHPIPMDILHNAFIGVTDALRMYPWRNELKVNEHMTFFLDAKDAGLRVGYLPSVFVHHRSRDYSDCYYKIRFREEEYRYLLPYRDQLNWDMKCQEAFPERIRTHILRYELEL